MQAVPPAAAQLALSPERTSRRRRRGDLNSYLCWLCVFFFSDLSWYSFMHHNESAWLLAELSSFEVWMCGKYLLGLLLGVLFIQGIEGKQLSTFSLGAF